MISKYSSFSLGLISIFFLATTGVCDPLSIGDKRNIHSLISQLDRRYDTLAPTLTGLADDNCPENFISQSKILASKDYAAIRLKKLSAYLVTHPQLQKVIKKSNAPAALYLKARLLEEVKPARTDFYSNLARAERTMKKAALKGFAPAEYRVGVIQAFLDENSPLRDRKNFYAFALNSANKNVPSAAAAVADYFAYDIYGAGGSSDTFVPLEDRVEVRHWHCRAADLGNVPSLTDCADDYISGIGGNSNTKKAIKYLKRGISKKSGYSYLLLAGLYERGDGVPQDNTKARDLRCESDLYGGGAFDAIQVPYP